MMNDETSGFKKKILTVSEYGDLTTDCSSASLSAGIPAFVIGAIGVPTALKYLDKFLHTSHEIKALGGVIGALTFSYYVLKITKERCERKITENFTVPWEIK